MSTHVHPSCCGITVWHGVSDDGCDSLLRHLRNKYGIITEVTATDNQLKLSPKFHGVLIDKGFRLVSRFINENSRNAVNIFHHDVYNEKQREKLLAESPFHNRG